MSSYPSQEPCTCGLVRCVCHDGAVRADLARYARRYGASPHDAESIVHDALIKVMGQRGQPIREPVAFLRVVIHNAVIDDLRSARRRTQSLESCEDGADPASVDQFAQVEADDRLVDPIKQRRLLADYQDAYDLSHKEMDPVRLFLSLYVLAEQGHALPALPSGTDIPNARNNIDRAVVHAYLQLHPDRRRPDPTKPRWRSSRATDQTKFKKRLEAHLRNLLGGPDSS